jgi:hypothetical protein
MLTTVWGPLIWTFLHIISFNYPVRPTRDDKNNYYNFMYYLGKVLPCRHCRDNYLKNLKATGYGKHVFESRATLSKYIYKLHCCVNKMLGKETNIKYSEARDMFELFRARCLDDVPSIPRKELGCTRPMSGKTKTKCSIRIVPAAMPCHTLHVDKRCH